MKKILLILTLFLLSCNEQKSRIVTYKSFTTSSFGNDLPKCICQYYYNGGNPFQDSCSKYSILDTIRGK